MFVSIMARDTDTEEARLDLRLCIWAGRDTASIPRNDKAISSLYARLFLPVTSRGVVLGQLLSQAWTTPD